MYLIVALCTAATHLDHKLSATEVATYYYLGRQPPGVRQYGGSYNHYHVVNELDLRSRVMDRQGDSCQGRI